MLKQLTVEAPDEKIRQIPNLSCRTVKVRSRVRTELIVFADFLSKKIFVHFLPTILRYRIN